MPAYRQHHQPIVVAVDHGNIGKKWDSTTQPHGSKRILWLKLTNKRELGQVLLRQWLDLHFYRAAQQRVNLILALKNEAHVKWSAVSTLMVGLGWRTNSTQAKLFGLSTVCWSSCKSKHCMSCVTLKRWKGARKTDIMTQNPCITTCASVQKSWACPKPPIRL